NIRPAARGHHFLTGCDESRTHDGRIFAAPAAAVALLEVADERMVFERECEPRFERQFDGSGEVISQVIVDLVTEAKNLSGIENIFWIERALDLAHNSEQGITELVTHVFCARDTDPVFGGDRSLELPDERGSLIGNQPHFFQILRRVKI